MDQKINANDTVRSIRQFAINAIDGGFNTPTAYAPQRAFAYAV